MPKRLLPSRLLTCLLVLAGFTHAATRVHSFQEVAISPDGSRVAWVAPAENAGGESIGGSAIYIGDPNSPNTKPSRISTVAGEDAGSEDHVAWSPDSKQDRKSVV